MEYIADRSVGLYARAILATVVKIAGDALRSTSRTLTGDRDVRRLIAGSKAGERLGASRRRPVHERSLLAVEPGAAAERGREHYQHARRHGARPPAALTPAH
jgi:hypothetical protein